MKKLTLAWVLGCLVLTQLAAQVRQEQDHHKSYVVEPNSKIEIINKYGEVIIQTWDHDSVKFDVLVRAEGRNSSSVRKSMDRVDVRFRKVGSIISAVTQVSSGGGLLGNLMNEVEGVVGPNQKLQVNYEIWLPENVDLSIENKFGDIYLSDLTGNVDINLSHGDLKGNLVSKSLSLKHSFGKASFEQVTNGSMTLRGSDIKIAEAIKLNVESGSSEIEIGKVDQIQFNSRNDKIKLDEVEQIICEGSFTDFTSDYISGTAKLDFSYGDIYLTRIDRYFSDIDITGKSTDINLILNQASYIKTYIKGPEDKMILPNSMLTMQKEEFDEEEVISLTGFVGNTNLQQSELSINATGGELIIAIKDTPIFSDKN